MHQMRRPGCCGVGLADQEASERNTQDNRPPSLGMTGFSAYRRYSPSACCLAAHPIVNHRWASNKMDGKNSVSNSPISALPITDLRMARRESSRPLHLLRLFLASTPAELTFLQHDSCSYLSSNQTVIAQSRLTSALQSRF